MTAATVASACDANLLTHAGNDPTPSISANASQKWLQFRARRSYSCPCHAACSAPRMFRTRAGESAVTPRGILSLYVYPVFPLGLQQYTPLPRSQYPNDHSSPFTSTAPWKIPPAPRMSLVNRFRPWMEAFAASYWVLVMSYTCRVTSDMTPVRRVARSTPPPRVIDCPRIRSRVGLAISEGSGLPRVFRGAEPADQSTRWSPSRRRGRLGGGRRRCSASSGSGSRGSGRRGAAAARGGRCGSGAPRPRASATAKMTPKTRATTERGRDSGEEDAARMNEQRTRRRCRSSCRSRECIQSRSATGGRSFEAPTGATLSTSSSSSPGTIPPCRSYGG